MITSPLRRVGAGLAAAAVLPVLATSAAAPAAAAPTSLEVSVVAGNGTAGAPEEGAGTALDTPLSITGLTAGPQGNLYFSDRDHHLVGRITPAGDVSVVAGVAGTTGLATAGGPAAGQPLDDPRGLAVDSHGDLYIADFGNQVVQKVDAATGSVSFVTYATGSAGGATSSFFDHPAGVAVDSRGDVHVSLNWRQRVVRVTPGGELVEVVGSGNRGCGAEGCGGGPDGGDAVEGPATSSQLRYPGALAVDANDDLYVADVGNRRVEKVTRAGQLSFVAGSGAPGDLVDGPATSSPLGFVSGLAVDAAGAVHLSDDGNARVATVTPGASGQPAQLRVVAGTGTSGAPVPGDALASPVGANGLALDGASGALFTDADHRIVKIAQPTPAPPAPSWWSPPDGTVGEAYSYTFTATGHPAPTWSVASGPLPDGLALDPATGTLAGVPTRAGSFPITLRGSNSLGSFTDSTWVRIVGTGPEAPVQVTATAGGANTGTATVRWGVTTATGGSPLTSFTVQPASTRGTTPRPVVVRDGAARSVRVSGLVPGRTYTFTVTATDAAGVTSAPSAPSAPLKLPIRCTVQRTGSTLTVTCPGGIRYTVPARGPSAGARQAPLPTCTATEEGTRALVSCSDGRQQSFAAPQ